MIHPLEKYLHESGRSKFEFAKTAGIGRTSLYRILAGDQNMTTDLMVKICAATGGKLKIDQLIDRGKK